MVYMVAAGGVVGEFFVLYSRIIAARGVLHDYYFLYKHQSRVLVA